MLADNDAALVIGDNALFLDYTQPPGTSHQPPVEKIDLGEAWTTMTGLPFVYACWVGRPKALDAADIDLLQHARTAGLANVDAIARDYFPASPPQQVIGAAYLRDNIKYYLGDEERAGLELFFRYAAETGAVPAADALRFY